MERRDLLAGYDLDLVRALARRMGVALGTR
jgi:ABC-type amino acid transport substrate-binding protein